MKLSTRADRLVTAEVYCVQDSLVNQCFDIGMFEYDDIVNMYDKNDEPQEIMQWVAISDWLGHKLREQGEPVLRNDVGTWWGRTTYGQSISMDTVIEDIVKTISK